jgi:hypothetical protein
MRYNTPITNSHQQDERSKTSSIYSITGVPVGSGGTFSSVGLKPAAYDMKETTTVRINNPNFRTHNVKATDNFSAPVAKLQAWLASDPTKAKKEFLTVRKGNNIIAKSNKFEKQTMAIGKKAKLLQDIAEKNVVTNNRKQFEKIDKDQSLYDAKGKGDNFVIEEEEPSMESLIIDVDKKQVFEEKEGEAISLSSIEESSADDASEEQKNKGNEGISTREDIITFSEALAEFQLDEDVPKLLSSVQIRKQNLEAMERQARHRANNPYGLMKSSWGRPNPSNGMPSTAWNHTLKGNPPPQKKLADLP